MDGMSDEITKNTSIKDRYIYILYVQTIIGRFASNLIERLEASNSDGGVNRVFKFRSYCED